MTDDVMVKVEHVSKKFAKTLKRAMLYGAMDITRNVIGMSSHPERLRKGEFWAVDDISFELRKGEAFGLIGSNGSGKTTILKMLNGIYWPDIGKITIKGRVGALIEVGAGFHPQLTGRENIYLNAAILGMTKKEVNAKIDDIIKFADIGDFLDTPLKFYSRGMHVRLGFAVAVHCEPDVLLVDEVLAVGDRNFAIKCYQKMHEIRKSGTTIVLVSHNEYTIKEQTERCIYLQSGKSRAYGETDDVISKYIKDATERMPINSESTLRKEKPAQQRARLTGLRFIDSKGTQVDSIESGQELNIIVECDIFSLIKEPIFGVNFYGDGGFMYCANNEYDQHKITECTPGKRQIKIKIPQFHLPIGEYSISTIIAADTSSNLIDWKDKEYSLIVSRAKNARGSIKLPSKWVVI